MITNTFWFWCVLICTILTTTCLVIGLIISKDRQLIKGILLNIGGIGLVANGLIGWLMIFGLGTPKVIYIPIENSKIQVYKTPVSYIVDFDKEHIKTYTDLSDCYLLDNKDSLYFYRKKSYNYYNNLVGERFLIERKPIENEQKEN